MGRETKILLGLLGTLGFVFLGALLARLLVARPPLGVGVDVHSQVSEVEPTAIVEPPEPGRPNQSAFSAVAAVAASSPEASTIGFDAPIDPIESDAVPAVAMEPIRRDGDGRDGDAVREEGPARSVEPAPAAESVAVRGIRQGVSCLVEEGDTWWSLSEAAYGDGRWYRGLYAWNRAMDSRVALMPGTTLVVPTMSELEAAYPGLRPEPADVRIRR